MYIKKPKSKDVKNGKNLAEKEDYTTLVLAVIQIINFNIELEHGLFPKDNLSLKNTIKTILEITNVKLELSNMAITIFFKLVVL